MLEGWQQHRPCCLTSSASTCSVRVAAVDSCSRSLSSSSREGPPATAAAVGGREASPSMLPYTSKTKPSLLTYFSSSSVTTGQKVCLYSIVGLMVR